MSEADRVSLRWIAESVYGSTPVSATWEAMRFTGETLAGEARTVESQQIRADRQIADIPLVGLDSTGGVDFEFSASSFDDFIEAAMMDAWSTNVTRVGTTEFSFTIEKEFQDLTNEFMLFKGMKVGTFDLNFRYGEIVTGNMTFLGNSATSADASANSSATTASNTNNVYDGANDVEWITIDGVTTTLFVQQINLSINNGLRPVEAISYLTPPSINEGRSRVTGSFSAYLNDMDLYDKLAANTALALEWQVGTNSQTYNFRIPEAIITTGSPQAGGPDTDVIPEYSFQARYHASAASQLIITRSV